MPLEDATHISDFVPDWPTGPSDPVSIGDDNLRMIKKVLQNDLPNINAPITGTPTQLNNLTSGMVYYAENASGNPEEAHWVMGKTDGSGAAVVQHSTPTLADLKLTNGPQISVTWGIIQNLLYPINSVVIYADSVNPATRLGFGTWVEVVGDIYGAGELVDASGLSHNFNAGKTAGDYRVQEKHIVAMTKDLTMDAVDDHQHDYFIYGPAKPENVYLRTTEEQAGKINEKTEPAGGHTPSGKVSIGAGSITSGEAFVTPGFGLFVWKRTA